MGLYKSLEDAYYGFMDFLDQKLHIPVYNMFINPIEKGGTPSFPVFILLILLIVAGIAGAAYLLFFQEQKASLKVLVLAGEEPIPGSLVKVSGEDLEFEAEADENGIVLFDKLPVGKTFRVEVTAANYDPASRSLTLEEPETLEFRLQVTQIDLVMLVEIVDEQGAPLAGAKVQYTSGTRTGSAITGSNGKARLSLPKGQSVSFIATKDGYQQGTGSTTVSSSEYRIVLKIKEAPQPPKELGKLRVTVLGEAGEQLNSKVKVYASDGGALPIDSQAADDGLAVFYNLEVGMSVKVVATASGYKDGKETVTMKSDTRLTIRMEKDTAPPPDDTTSVTVKDGKSKSAISDAKVYLFTTDDELVVQKDTSSSGVAIFEEAKVEPYYAIVTAPDYVYGKVFIIGGEQKEVLLYKEADTLIYELKLVVKDEDGRKAVKAPIAMFDEFNDVVPPFDAKTDAKGEYSLKLPIQYYNIKVTSGALSGEESLDLDKNTVLNMTLVFPRGTYSMLVLDLDTNQSIITNRTSSYNVEVYDKLTKKTNSTSCRANPCFIDLIATREYKLSFSANGYYGMESVILENEIKPDEVTNTTLYMKNTLSTTNLKILWSGLFDVKNPNAPVANVIPGNIYATRYSLFWDENSSRNGIYLRVGDQLQIEGVGEGSEADGYIMDYALGGSIAPGSVKGSTSFLPDVCTTSNKPKNARWIFAEYDALGSQTIYFTVKADEAMRAPELLDLFYNAYTSLSNGTIYSDPQGAEKLEDCNAPVYTQAFPFTSTGGEGEMCSAPPHDECESEDLYCDEETNTCKEEEIPNPMDYCDESAVQKVFQCEDGGTRVESSIEQEGTNFYDRKGELLRNCPTDEAAAQSPECRALFSNCPGTVDPLCDNTPPLDLFDPQNYCAAKEVIDVRRCTDNSAAVRAIYGLTEVIGYYDAEGNLIKSNCPPDASPLNNEACWQLSSDCASTQTITCKKPFDATRYCLIPEVQKIDVCADGSSKVVMDVDGEDLASYYNYNGDIVRANCPVQPNPADGKCWDLDAACDVQYPIYCDRTGSLPAPDYRECPSLSVTKTAKGKISPNCERVVMKVDSIFPADAIELKFASESGPVLERVEFYSSSGTQVFSCFEYDSRNHLLKYNPSSSGCPAEYQPVGNDVPAAEFVMKVYMNPLPNPQEIPIIVQNDETVPEGQNTQFFAIEASYIEYKAPDVTPFSYYGFDDESYSKLRTAYVLNNRQMQVTNDDLSITQIGASGASSVIPKLLFKSKNRGGAKLFTWDGYKRNTQLGLAAETDSGKKQVLTFGNNDYSSNSLPDLMGWSDDYAEDEAYMSNEFASDRMNSFLEMAKRTSYNSVFRRGGTKPYSYFFDLEKKPIQFSMVIAERANAIFNNYQSGDFGFDVKVLTPPPQCDVRMGIYKLTVRTSDGDSWGYEGSDFGLENLNITRSTDGNCDPVPACNLFDAFYGSPDIYYDSDTSHCFANEWPIVPDGNEEYNEEMLDLREAIFLGVEEGDPTYTLDSYNDEYDGTNYPAFALDYSQQEELTGASIFYKLTNDTDVLIVPPYLIESYPVFFSGEREECVDADGDGYGDGQSLRACAGTEVDCDDTDELVYPGAEELCDQIDNNCNLIIDELVIIIEGEEPQYGEAFLVCQECIDADEDGYSPNPDSPFCADAGLLGTDVDCKDNDASINPGETEIENDGIDNDCDTSTRDDGSPDITFQNIACEQINNYVLLEWALNVQGAEGDGKTAEKGDDQWRSYDSVSTDGFTYSLRFFNLPVGTHQLDARAYYDGKVSEAVSSQVSCDVGGSDTNGGPGAASTCASVTCSNNRVCNPSTLLCDTCRDGYIMSAGECRTLYCQISGQEYFSGLRNPANLCQKCDTRISTTSWSNLEDGTSCGVNQICSSGQCIADSNASDNGGTNGDNGECQPSCGEGYYCEGTTCLSEQLQCTDECDPGFICENGQCIGNPNPAVVISDLSFNTVTSTSVKITWKTDVYADSQVWLNDGIEDISTEATQRTTRNHNYLVTGLEPGTRYTYRVASCPPRGESAACGTKSSTQDSDSTNNWFRTLSNIPQMPRMVCIGRTGHEGGENDACDRVAIVSDPKPIAFEQLPLNDWKRGRRVTADIDQQLSNLGNKLCDGFLGSSYYDCSRDCWNIIGEKGNRAGGNDGLDDVFCHPGKTTCSSSSPPSFSGCSDNGDCKKQAIEALKTIYNKMVVYHWSNQHDQIRNCADDDGYQAYKIQRVYCYGVSNCPS